MDEDRELVSDYSSGNFNSEYNIWLNWGGGGGGGVYVCLQKSRKILA